MFFHYFFILKLILIGFFHSFFKLHYPINFLIVWSFKSFEHPSENFFLLSKKSCSLLYDLGAFGTVIAICCVYCRWKKSIKLEWLNALLFMVLGLLEPLGSDDSLVIDAAIELMRVKVSPQSHSLDIFWLVVIDSSLDSDFIFLGDLLLELNCLRSLQRSTFHFNIGNEWSDIKRQTDWWRG